MLKPTLRIVTLNDRPDLHPEINRLAVEVWPEFMLHDPVIDKHWSLIYERFPEYQFFLLAEDDSRALAAGNSCPLPWDGDLDHLPEGGIDWIIAEMATHDSYQPRNQFALQIMVDPAYLGQGLSGKAVAAMAAIGRASGCRHLIAPVRPNRKCDYPLISMNRYVRWTRDDGLPFDPWMRVHARLGAGTLHVCERSMYIPGTVAEWEQWTGLPLPDSGAYIIPGALVPITVDRERDLAEYVEPNVWMVHQLIP